MFNKENIRTFRFALIVCVICSFSLAAVSQGLRARREFNESLDVKKNILKVMDLRDPLPPHTSGKKVLEVYNSKVTEAVIDPEGKIVKGEKPSDIKEGQKLYPLYIYKEDGKPVAYAFPIVGHGLWSTLYGYLSIEPDAITVRGITFYKHGETPGLGAEISSHWFQANFKGKKIWDTKEDKLHPVSVVKGKVKDVVAPDQQQFYVDGISGATMTSKGVTELLDREIRKYEPFFKKIRGT